MEQSSGECGTRSTESWNGCIHWLKWRFRGCENGLAGAPEFRIAMAEKRATWVITKKVFFQPSKKPIFLQFLKIVIKYSF